MTITKLVEVGKVEPLRVFCFDALTITDRVSFVSCLLNGIRMTYWLENVQDEGNVLNKIFDVLFREVRNNN
jgi:hypothetical protein